MSQNSGNSLVRWLSERRAKDAERKTYIENGVKTALRMAQFRRMTSPLVLQGRLACKPWAFGRACARDGKPVRALEGSRSRAP